ncbi:MAG: 4-(cytidine 5'-diphospho)-2-C-methyl-D-erythritol kinase [Candidatus Eisenbacteria bacterium]|nr:4-(cytidine 5'-diphospho)-2-C-methyl-D-erythritol kinase [Candidatus Eisenbacteria bacterium]
MSRARLPAQGALVARAPAKLNLGLWITRRRRDGYHDLVTLFQAIDLYDRLMVRPRKHGLRLTADARELATDQTNLIIRAALALAAETGVTAGAEFELQKRIPWGAGLGGGSSDAAAALVLLDRLWGTGLSHRQLARIGAGIGSDVPFFLQGGLQLGRGRGTRLRPLITRTRFEFVVVHGRQRIDTGWAYSRYERELTGSKPPPNILALAEGGSLSRTDLAHLENNLEAGLVPDVPDITERKRLLTSLGARVALLTGSGASVFGIFATREMARRARNRVIRRGWSADLCRSVSSGVVVEGG